VEAAGSSHAFQPIASRLIVVAINVVARNIVVVVASCAIPWCDGDAWAEHPIASVQAHEEGVVGDEERWCPWHC